MDNKVYRAKVRIGHTEDGRPIDKYISAHSPEELEKLKDATRMHYLYGKPIPKDRNCGVSRIQALHSPCRGLSRPGRPPLTHPGVVPATGCQCGATWRKRRTPDLKAARTVQMAEQQQPRDD